MEPMKTLPLASLCLILLTAAESAQQQAKGYALQFPDTQETAYLDVQDVGKAFPEEPKGKDVTYPWLPKKQFRLISFSKMVSSAAGPQPIIYPWGAEETSIDWQPVEGRVEVELRRLFIAKPAATSPTNQPTSGTAKSLIPGSLEVSLSNNEVEKMG